MIRRKNIDQKEAAKEDKGKSGLSKKAFFLSLMAFMILMYITASLSLKFAAVEESRGTYMEMMRQSTYRMSFSAINKRALEQMFHDICRADLYRLAEHAALHPVKVSSLDNVPAPYDKLGLVKLAMYQLIVYGGASDNIFSDGKGMNDSPSLTTLLHEMNQSLKDYHLYIKSYNLSNETSMLLEMADYKTVHVALNLSIEVEDERGLGAFNLSFPLEANISIEGMPDPLINRYLNLSGFEGRKYIYFGPYEYFPSLTGPIEVWRKPNVTRGQGWVSGYIVTKPDIATNYILFGNFSSIMLTSAKGYIINGSKERGSIDCKSGKKETVEKSFNALDYMKQSDDTCKAALTHDIKEAFFINYNGTLDLQPNRYYLLITDVTPPEAEGTTDPVTISEAADSLRGVDVYDISDQRLAMWKGYYFHWNAQYKDKGYSDAPPDFLQRLLLNGQDLQDADNGIFSFIVTEELNTQDMSNPLSRAGFEMARQVFSKKSYNLVVPKGFSGCKDPWMCKMPLDQYSVGKMAMSDKLANALGLKNISCSWHNSWGGCYS